MVLGVLTANRKLNTSYLTLDVHVDKYGRGEQVSRGFEFRWPVRRGPSIRNKRSTLTFWPYVYPLSRLRSCGTVR